MKLTLKQKKFADEYIESGNAEQSAIKAGYSPKYARGNAHKLVAISCIKEYINKQLAKMEEDKIAKAEEVLKYLTSVLRGEEVEEVIVVEGLGDGNSRASTMDKQVSAKERIKAAELLGKRYALFVEKTELTGEVKTTNPLAGLTTAELKAIAKKSDKNV